jgi:hypothetical protein
MELIVSIFVSNGTQNILDEDIKAARQSAWFACYFEEYLVSELCRKRATIDWQKVQEFERADERTLISFLRKRIDCQCLDGKYKQVKRIVTKMGICMNPHCSLPDRQVEQKIMQKCARCRCAYYCSRECQKADWKFIALFVMIISRRKLCSKQSKKLWQNKRLHAGWSNNSTQETPLHVVSSKSLSLL